MEVLTVLVVLLPSRVTSRSTFLSFWARLKSHTTYIWFDQIQWIVFRGWTHTREVFEEVIPCSCLDEKQKSQIHNKNGDLLQSAVQFISVLGRTQKDAVLHRCRDANYCSPECQATDWPEHKKFFGAQEILWISSESKYDKQKSWLSV